MATKLVDTPEGTMVYTVVGNGKRRRIPRKGVLVPYGDSEALKKVIIDQALAARAAVGLVQP